MNKPKTPLEDKVLSDKVVPLLVALVLASMDSRISFKEVDKVARVDSPSVIYSMSSKRCLVVVEVSREAPQTNNRKDKTSC